jgi:hypothetical protein
MTNVLIICTAIVLVALLLFFAFIIYHQMLLLNEVNKRLMMDAKESRDHERTTSEEYSALVQEFNNRTTVDTVKNILPEDEDETPFDPHDYS